MHVLRLSRRRLLPALLLALALLAAVLFFALRSPGGAGGIVAPGSAGCAAYLEQLGWAVDPDPIETLQLRLPEDLPSSRADYAALQRSQGLPFAEYGGQTVCRYTFRLTNYPGGRTDAQANLLLCGSVLIAGDVMLLGADGGQFPLAFPRQAA